MAKPEECIFCGGKPLTREHIWPSWMRPHVSHDLTSYTKQVELVHETNSEFVYKKGGGDPRNRPVRVVCARCNNGWMSRLQDSAKPFLLPLISGQKACLDEGAQELIAAWCAMSVMTSEFLSLERQAVPPKERLWLKDSMRPPAETWKIWVGHYVRQEWLGMWAHQMMPIYGEAEIPNPTEGNIPAPNTQTTTLVVGELYIHAFSSVHDFLVRRTELSEEKISQIWPIRTKTITWPTRTLTDKCADYFASAITSEIDTADRRKRGVPPR